MIVYRLETEFCPRMTSNHFRFPFAVKKPGTRLRIFYRYTPKVLQNTTEALSLIKQCYLRYGIDAPPVQIRNELPLHNLITLSIDSPLGLAGTAHRHANQAEYFIGLEEASPGFNKTEIVSGDWAVVLSTHAVLSEKVKAEVEIYVD